MEETKAQRRKRTYFFIKERTPNKTNQNNKTNREANMSSADRHLNIEQAARKKQQNKIHKINKVYPHFTSYRQHGKQQYTARDSFLS